MWDDDEDLESTLMYGDPFGHSEPHIRKTLDARRIARQHARDVLTLAHHADMPDTYWASDQRIKRALDTLGLNREQVEEMMDTWLDQLVIKPREITDWANG